MSCVLHLVMYFVSLLVLYCSLYCMVCVVYLRWNRIDRMHCNAVENRGDSIPYTLEP